MGGIGFIPAIWLVEALRDKVFPNSRSYTAASLILDACDLDGRWCFLRQDTVVERSGRILSLSTVKRAIDDLLAIRLVRKLPRPEVEEFFAEDLAAGRRRADNLPDVLEVLIPASAFTRHDPRVLEEINEVRARLGEEPITPENRPDLATAGHPDLPRRVMLNPRDRSDRPTDLFPDDPCPVDPSPDPVRERVTTGPPVPRPRPAPEAGPAWALELLARIPDGALHHPRQDRHLLATRLVALRAQGLAPDELSRALDGWQGTASPFAALRARLASPDTVRAWNAGALIRALPRPREPQDAFSHRPEFTLDSQGRAARTCPEHPSVRNAPGGACTVCGAPCRTHPDEIVHPFADTGRGGTLERLLGPPGVDERFTAPKCDDERCNPDRASPRYRTVIRLAAGGEPVAVPCPACGRRARSSAPAA